LDVFFSGQAKLLDSFVVQKRLTCSTNDHRPYFSVQLLERNVKAEAQLRARFAAAKATFRGEVYRGTVVRDT